MCVVAVVVVDGVVAQDGDLAAFVDGELRGIARASSYTAPVGPYKGFKSYNLIAYGEADAQGASVTFQYRHTDGRVSKLTPMTPFSKDAFVGSLVEPYVISHSTTPSVTPTPTSKPTPTPTGTPTPTAAPTLAPSIAAFPATDGTSTALDWRLVVAVGAMSALVLLLAGLCAWRNSGRVTKATPTKEVVLPRKIDAVSAA
mmetsp:Transcript_82053/g.163400  ORF Transcript_82053/g.163400 Transcript_82053/m.163400 type:complete len:200 (-) Transcript_82053:568-1167(-)